MRRRWLLLGPVLGVLACFNLQLGSSSSSSSSSCAGPSTGLLFGYADGGSPCTVAGGTCEFQGCVQNEYADNGLSCADPAATCCIPTRSYPTPDAEADDAAEAGDAGDGSDAVPDGWADGSTDGPTDATGDAEPAGETGDGP